MNEIKVILGNSCQTLGNLITNTMNISPLNCILDKFSNGEIRVEIKESIRNKDIYIIQTGYSNEKNDYNTSDYLVETLIIIDACRRSMAKSINVISLMSYSRQAPLISNKCKIICKFVNFIRCK